MLERYAGQFCFGSWVAWLRGQIMWQLGELDAAIASLEEALEQKDSAENLLGLAHYYLENEEQQTARQYARQALEKAPRNALCLLSQAVLMYEMGQVAEAVEWLARAQRQDRSLVRANNLQYGYFWGPKAIAAVNALLLQLKGG